MAAFAPMHGASVADSHDSEGWNQPLNTDRYFSQTERYHQEENKWLGPAISQRGGIVFLLTSHLFSTRYYFASVWQQFLKKCWQRLHRCFWFNSLSVRMVKLFCNRNMITYHSTNLCSPRMVDYCDLWECKENWK
jgi:hypothetical protein